MCSFEWHSQIGVLEDRLTAVCTVDDKEARMRMRKQFIPVAKIRMRNGGGFHQGSSRDGEDVNRFAGDQGDSWRVPKCLGVGSEWHSVRTSVPLTCQLVDSQCHFLGVGWRSTDLAQWWKMVIHVVLWVCTCDLDLDLKVYRL